LKFNFNGKLRFVVGFDEFREPTGILTKNDRISDVYLIWPETLNGLVECFNFHISMLTNAFVHVDG